MKQTRRSGFAAFRAALSGHFTEISDWSDVILHANQHLIGPALYTRIRAADDTSGVDPEALAYLEQQYLMNIERNRRIKGQARELGKSLAERGVRASLIKGAALVVRSPDAADLTRITSDIDLVVQQDDVQGTRDCLVELGYEAMEGKAWGHSPGSFARPDVVAAIDLHAHLPEAIEPVVSLTDILSEGIKLDDEKGQFCVPTTEQHVLLNVAHEMLHDRFIAKGFASLRYLFELAELEPHPDRLKALIDDAAKRSNRLKLALELQDRLAEVLLDKRIFAEVERTSLGYLLHARRMLKLSNLGFGHFEWIAVRNIRRFVGGIRR